MKAEEEQNGRCGLQAHRRRTDRGPVRVRGQPLNSSSARGIAPKFEEAIEGRSPARSGLHAEPKDGLAADRRGDRGPAEEHLHGGRQAGRRHPLRRQPGAYERPRRQPRWYRQGGGRRARQDGLQSTRWPARPSTSRSRWSRCATSRFGLQPLLLRFDAATARLRRDGCCCGSRTPLFAACPRTHRPGTSGFGQDGTSSERSRLHVSTSHDAHLGKYRLLADDPHEQYVACGP